jgi:hypothetical protein
LDGIFCDDCGAKLDEAPTLLPDQRPPCPRCGSLARRFEQTITNTVVLSDGGTATDALNVAKADGPATIAHAQPATLTVTAHDATVSIEAHAEAAEGVGEAFDATVETRSGTARVEARVEGRTSGVRLPRRIADQLVVMGRLLEWTPLSGHLGRMTRSLWWVQLSEQPTWLVQVVDETGELIGGGIELENDQIDAFVGVAKDLLPSGAGPTLLTIRDQAGETITGGLGYDSIEGLAAVAEHLLPRHPG